MGDPAELFHRQGFAGPFTLCEPGLAAKLFSRAQDEVFAHRSEVYAHTHAHGGTMAYRKSLDPETRRDRHLDSPMLYRLAAAPEVLAPLAKILGPDILLWKSDTFEQTVGDRITEPHQDAAYDGANPIPMVEAPRGSLAVGRQTYPSEVDIPLSVAVWFSFTQVRKETGAMWVVPGSHHAVVPLEKGEGLYGRPMVMSRKFGPDEQHPIELEAGQFIIFHNLLVHGSFPTERGSRFAWVMRYVTPDTLIYPRSNLNGQFQDLSRYGAVLVMGQDRFQRNMMRSPPPVGTSSIEHERALTPLGYGS